MRASIRVGYLASALLLAACGSKNEAGSDGGSAPYPVPPRGGQAQGETNLARLLTEEPEGKPRTPLWSGYWFPYQSGGTSSALTQYEKASGNAGAVSWERAHHGPEGAAGWWGHCNGWSAASALFDEPRSPRTVGGVVLSVADQKALLTEIAMEVTADFFGNRSDVAGDISSSRFEDVLPNQFLLVLTNYIGRAGLPVIMDRYAGNQVWNHPIAGYRLAPLHPADSLGTGPGGLFRLNMTAQVWWVRDDVEPGHLTEAFSFQDGPSYESRVYHFEVWLDHPPVFDGSGKLTSSGNVVVTKDADGFVKGGVWTNTDLSPVDSHPDYLWVPKQVAPSTGNSNPNLDPAWVLRNIAGQS